MLTPRFISLALLCASISTCYPQASSPVDVRIAYAQKQLAASPKAPEALNSLAFAWIRKGRDLRDDASYAEASKLVDQSLRVSPKNFDAQKLRVAILLAQHNPEEALKLATELNRKTPDDIVVWALLVDANLDLGHYDQAEKDAQWVLDLRPGSSIGFEKAAALREWFGDTEGAVEFLDEANRRTSMNDIDQKAWLLTQKARLILGTGNTKGASELLAEALRLFPDSQLAEGVMAQVKRAEGDYPDAAALLEKRYRRVPSAANLCDWAEALAAAGKNQEALLEFAKFETQARADLSKHGGATLNLIRYYSDIKPDATEALTLAGAEAMRRQDSPTLAAYAWALNRNGQFPEAKLQIGKALAVGVRNPLYQCYAAAIASMLKDAVCPANPPLQSANQVNP